MLSSCTFTSRMELFNMDVHDHKSPACTNEKPGNNCARLAMHVHTSRFPSRNCKLAMHRSPLFATSWNKKKKWSNKYETAEPGGLETTQPTSNGSRKAGREAKGAGEGEIKTETGPVALDGFGINIELLSC